MNKYQQFYDNITNFIFIEDEIEKSDVIFIPGNRYPDMAEYAAHLWKQGYGKWILPSGRFSIVSGCFQGPCKDAEKYNGTYKTEWEFLRDVLIKNGVSPDVILKEDQATFTYDNAIRSRSVLKAENITLKKGIICCSSVHARRCKMYYELVFPDTHFMIAPVNAAGITRRNWYQTQNGIESVLSEMDRCGRQFQQILEEMI